MKHSWRILARDFESSKAVCRTCGMTRYTAANRGTARFPTSRFELHGIVSHGSVPICTVPVEAENVRL